MNHGRHGYAGRGHPNNRGRSPRSGDNSNHRPRHAGGEGPSVAGSSNACSGAFRGRSSHQIPSRNFGKHFVQKQALSSEQWQWRPLNSGKDASPGALDLQQQHNSADDMGNASEQSLGFIAPNSDSNELSLPSAQSVTKNLLSAVESIQIREPTAEGESCSDSLPYDNSNRSDAVDQDLMVQVPLESCAKDEDSSIKLRENNNVSDCKGSEDKKPSVNLDPFDDSLPYDNSNRSDAVDQDLMVQVPLESCAKDEDSSIKLRENNNVSDCKGSEDKKPSVNLDPFDICPPKSDGVMLNPSLLAKNREKRNEMKRAMEGNSGIMLRPGMVHLKSGISLRDQVMIVKRCRELGIGDGGFYQPGYREGGKLHLKMMCLGKNWDPDTSTYGDVRPFDGTKPPGIPVEFYQLVEKAIKDSYAIVGKDSTTKNPERVLPWMKPNICIVNFYSQNGRLGLHQDRDESRESLEKGLPVVSFSIGDSAEFLFGDRGDTDQAERVTLKSGDILIFGGKSRHVFHGVNAIQSNTAPKALLEETNLRRGRLNLTFRQY